MLSIKKSQNGKNIYELIFVSFTYHINDFDKSEEEDEKRSQTQDRG